MTDLLTPVPWNKNFETGIPQIDEQHQQLAKLVNQLSVYIKSVPEQPELTSILQQLQHYSRLHFETEANLREGASVFENALEAICVTDKNEIIISANPAFYQSSGYTQDEVIGKSLADIKSGLQNSKLKNSITQQLSDNYHWRGEVHNRNKTGEIQSEWLSISIIRDENHHVIRYINMFSNISHLIKEHAELKHNAHHDALTQLPNRLLLAARLEQSIHHAFRKKEKLAVCFVDLDGFKPINDTYGHDIGDLVLCEISNRIKHIIRGNDTVARIGGDEFVVLFTSLSTLEEAYKPLNRLLDEICRGMTFNGKPQEYFVTASIGVALYPDDSATAEDLLHQADQAMYNAKNSGKSQYKFHQQ